MLRRTIKTGFWENPDFVAFPVKRTKLVLGNERIFRFFIGYGQNWFLGDARFYRVLIIVRDPYSPEYRESTDIISDFYKMSIVYKEPKASGTGLSS